MRFTFAAASALALSFLSTGVAAAVAPRQIVESQHGTTVKPASGTTVAHGSAFAFSYTNQNLCHSGYTPISVYLSTSAPTSSDVTTSGGLANGSYVYHFGDYLIANFGLSTKGTPPPSTLTMPTVSGAASGKTLYFSVVETYRDCPGGIPLEYGLETTTVVYA
ncbi:hypothetical protein V8D89_011962 [Ganoderma adspersum]